MKIALVLTLCMTVFNSFANAEVKIFEKATVRSLSYTTNFEVNPKLERAWLVITEIDDSFEETDEREFRVKLDGLAFNSNTNEIIYTDSDSNKIVCAYYFQKRGIFGYKRINKTNNCKINKSYKVQEVDDGFYIKKILKVLFYFSV